MVVLNRIYTRTGDDGTTALGNGERRPKYDLRVSAYGAVDETNAAIGVARLHLQQATVIDAMLITSTAFLVQSEDGRVVILAYRGTDPRISPSSPSGG